MPAKLRLRHALAMPLLLTGLVAGGALVTSSDATELTPVSHSYEHTYTTARVVVMKPVVDPDRWVLPVDHYRLTGRFGDVSGLWATVHTGLDFAAPTGTPIHAISRGEVVEVGWAGAYGYRTVLRLTDGTELWFCHQSSTNVTVGQRVTAGQVIGYIGTTGNTTGPHLHLEVHPHGGDAVDPFTSLVAHDLRP